MDLAQCWVKGQGKESAARNSHLTNEPEADGVLILRHSLHQSFITKLLQATRKGEKSKEGFEVINEDRNRDILPTRPRPKQLR